MMDLRIRREEVCEASGEPGDRQPGTGRTELWDKIAEGRLGASGDRAGEEERHK